MKYIYPYSIIARVIIGFCLVFLGLKCINDSVYTYIESSSLTDTLQSNNLNLELSVIIGIYLILFGIILIKKTNAFIKILIGYSLITPTFYLFYFLLFSAYTFYFNISVDFISRLFAFSGMFFCMTLICDLNNFNYKKHLKSLYKVYLIIGAVLGLIKFYCIYNIYFTVN